MQHWKIILKKVLLITASVVGIGAFIVLVTSAVQKQQTLVCSGVDVRIDYESGLSFLSEKEVVDNIQRVCSDSVKHLKKAAINLKTLEAEVALMPFVDSAELFFNQAQQLQVRIKQKRPILRIINSDGVGYYLTDKNQTMPLCSTFTARVPLALGKVYLNESVYRDSIIQQGLFGLATAIQKDSFLNAFIDQIVIDENGEAELIPLSGNHSVLFGFAHKNAQKKLQRLKTFYKDVMPRKGWSTYAKLNVKFENQVVCIKREATIAADTVSAAIN